MPRNFELDHLRLPEGRKEGYKAPRSGRNFHYPERQRESHAQKLRTALSQIESQFSGPGKTVKIEGKPSYDLKVGSLSDSTKDQDILFIREGLNNEKIAIVRFTKHGLSKLNKKISEYETKDNPKSGLPKNNDLITGIDQIRDLIFEDIFYGNILALPEDESKKIWWEIWARGGINDPVYSEKVREELASLASEFEYEIDVNKRIDLIERQVFLVFSSLDKLREVIARCSEISEVRLPSNVVVQILTHEGHDVANLSNLNSLVDFPESDAPSVAIIDTGVNHLHPLLEKIFLSDGIKTIDPVSESTADSSPQGGHGTPVAGVAAYGNLSDFIGSVDPKKFGHWLESVRIKLDEDGSEKELWGLTTRKAVEAIEKDRSRKRIFNLSIGADCDPTIKFRTSWSTELDRLAYNDGEGRLITIAAGNVSYGTVPPADYPLRNLATFLDDPAFAVNGICVGGFTTLTDILPPRQGFQVLAKKGQLSPFSKCGKVGELIKPDIVCEAGNYVTDGTMNYHPEDGSSILTTGKNYNVNPYVNNGGTSMAAPNAARMIAFIWASNSQLRPATIRGLLIHSASHTPEMKTQFPIKSELIRTCGYGVPDLLLASRSATSAATLIAEDEILLSNLQGESSSDRQVSFYDLPWPSDALLNLGQEKVELRVTLSFFIEPTANGTADYSGASLGWHLQNSTEPDDTFHKRINGARRQREDIGFHDEIPWEIGSQMRSKGSVQSDRWLCTAAQLASCKKLAVFPKYGWWEYNKKIRPDQRVKYSLIVSIITETEEIDIYSKIENEISVQVET